MLSPLLYRVGVYNPTINKKSRLPSLTTQVKIYRADTIVFEGPVHQVGINSARSASELVVAGKLDLSDFEPGTYLVELRVTDLLRKKDPNSLRALREIELFR